MPSHFYQLFAEAMALRRPVACVYKGHPRAICPVLLGHSSGVEKALTWQFAGRGSEGEVTGQWKCLALSEVRNAQMIDALWRTGERHSQAQSCVRSVDFDVNPDSPYAPRSRLAKPRVIE